MKRPHLPHWKLQKMVRGIRWLCPKLMRQRRFKGVLWCSQSGAGGELCSTASFENRFLPTAGLLDDITFDMLKAFDLNDEWYKPK
jgi:hypothetical protein